VCDRVEHRKGVCNEGGTQMKGVELRVNGLCNEMWGI